MSKYRAVKTSVDGIVFDSKKEAARYGGLKVLLAAGLISNLSVKPPPFILHALGGGEVGKYKPDFIYWEGAEKIVEDVKGGNATKTPIYRRNKKHMKAEYNIEIRET